MDNGRYVPVGIYCGDDRWLPDGIWYVRHHDNSLWLHYGGDGNMDGGGKYKSWDLPFFTLENSDSDEDVD